jgi:hypothetical protein
MKNNLTRATLAASVLLFAAAASAQTIRVTVDGERVNFPDQQPRETQGRVLVPLRGVFEEMGAYVRWDAQQRTVFAQKGQTEIRLRPGDRTVHVNGQPRSIDVPAQLVNGRTMVPLRFISESLGAEVEWVSTRNEVVINTNGMRGAQTAVTRPGTTPAGVVLLEENTVLPVRLEGTLASDKNRRGDTFTATLDAPKDQRYAGLPNGTQVVGEVVTARPQQGEDPGVIEIAFNRIRLPDGRMVPFDGRVISLEQNAVERRGDGVLVARPERRNDRLIYIGVGAAAGMLVGILTDRRLEGTILGGVLGYLYGEQRSREAGQPRNVVLQPGTRMGVLINNDVRIDRIN